MQKKAFLATRSTNGMLTMSVGGVTVALESGAGMALRVSPVSERFLVAGGPADVTVTAQWGDLRGAPAGNAVFDSDGLWRLYRDGTGFRFRFVSPFFGEHAYKEAWFNADFTSGCVTLHAPYFDRAKPALPLEYPLDELLYTNYLARGRGVEVHALGLRDHDGRGYLFLGHSGAGKTTSARLWERHGVLILSDDRIILRQVDGRVRMYGTPWHGEAELAEATSTEITRIFVLGRGTRNESVPLPAAQAVSELFARSFVPFYSASALGASLEFLEKVAAAVPCAALRFVPDGQVVDFVRETARA